jgi:hypothetical protein
VGSPDDFVGQFGSSQFIVITKPEVLSILDINIRSRLEKSLDYFYPLGDRDERKLPKKKLAVRLSTLESDQGLIKDLGHLKNYLMKKK